MESDIKKLRAGVLVQYYIRSKGMSAGLADAVLVCRWAETLLSRATDAEAALRIQPVFEVQAAELRKEWSRIRTDLFFDTLDACPVRWPNWEDPEEDRYIPWTIQDQETLLFGRWAYLFK